MAKQRILFFTGVWVVVVPFLGLPILWKDILFVITGVIIMYISYREYHNHKMKELRGEDRMQPYVESKPVNTNSMENMAPRRLRKRKESLNVLEEQVQELVREEVEKVKPGETEHIIIRREEIMTD